MENYLENSFREETIDYNPNNSFNGISIGPLNKTWHHGERKLQMYRYPSAHQVQIWIRLRGLNQGHSMF